MVVDENEMIKIEGYDLEKKEVISTSVEFNSVEADENLNLAMEFSDPKMKKQITIQNVELPRFGTSGTKRKELF
jgi:hypothetical protein